MYDHEKLYPQVAAASFASTGVKLTYSPGLIPVKLRGVAVVVTTQMTVTAPILTPKRRPTAGSASGEVALATVTTPTSAVAGKVIWKRGYSTTIAPGENVVADVTTAATAGAADVILELEPVWENIANNANAIASA